MAEEVVYRFTETRGCLQHRHVTNSSHFLRQWITLQKATLTLLFPDNVMSRKASLHFQDGTKIFLHHHHHHPRISSQCKSWTRLQGRYVSRITLQL